MWWTPVEPVPWSDSLIGHACASVCGFGQVLLVSRETLSKWMREVTWRMMK